MQNFNQINSQIVILFIFGFIILISFLLLIIFDDTRSVKQKILGGLSVFSVALISKNSYIIFASLFIGGLIIASEQFMKDLAGILRADSKDIKDILNYANASPEEIKEKNKEESKELVSIEEKKPISDFKDIQKRIEQREKIERMVLNFIPQTLQDGWRMIPSVKIVTESGQSIVIDGLLKNDLNPSWNAYVFEIKYLADSIKNKFTLRRIIESFTGKILSNVKNVNVAIVLVGDNLSEETVISLKEEIKRDYSNISLAIFSWNTEKELVEKVDKKESII